MLFSVIKYEHVIYIYSRCINLYKLTLDLMHRLRRWLFTRQTLTVTHFFLDLDLDLWTPTDFYLDLDLWTPTDFYLDLTFNEPVDLGSEL